MTERKSHAFPMFLIVLAAAVALLGMAFHYRLGSHDSSPAQGLWPFIFLLLAAFATFVVFSGATPPTIASAASVTLVSLSLVPAAKYRHLYDSFDSILFAQYAQSIRDVGGIPSEPHNFPYLDFPLLEALTAGLSHASGASVDFWARVLIPLTFGSLPFLVLGIARMTFSDPRIHSFTAASSVILYKNNFYLYMNLSLAVVLSGFIVWFLIARERNTHHRVLWSLLILLFMTAIVVNHPFSSFVLVVYVIALTVASLTLHKRLFSRIGLLREWVKPSGTTYLAAVTLVLMGAWWVYRADGYLGNIIHTYVVSIVLGSDDLLVGTPLSAGERHSQLELLLLVLGYLPGTLILCGLASLGFVLLLTKRSEQPSPLIVYPLVWVGTAAALLVAYFALPISVLYWRLLCYALLLAPILVGVALAWGSRWASRRPSGRTLLALVLSALFIGGAFEFYTTERWPYGYGSNVDNTSYQSNAMVFLGDHITSESRVLAEIMGGYQLVGLGGLEHYPHLYFIGLDGAARFADLITEGTLPDKVERPTYIPLHDNSAGRMYSALNTNGRRDADQRGAVLAVLELPRVDRIYDNGHSFIGYLQPAPRA